MSLVLAMGDSRKQALTSAQATAGDFMGAWLSAAEAAEARWVDAFTPKAAASGGGHFSGSFPVLVSPSLPLSKLYYMSCLAILQAERTNLPQFAPRVYVTASGNGVFLGDPWGPPQLVDIGGTAQYAWDQSFYPVMAALLDPDAQRRDLLAWNDRNFSTTYGIELDNSALTGHFYAFNAMSLYSTYSGYLRATNDSTLLDLVDGPHSRRYLESLCLDFQRYIRNSSAYPLFADYSGDKDAYLECVPTYRHATAGLQASSVYMARDLASLRQAQGNFTGAAALRRLADAITATTVSELYVSGGGGGGGDTGGWWTCLDTATGTKTEVRTVVDLVYTAMGFCNTGRGASWGCGLADGQRAQMVEFAQTQLIVGGWLRALSPHDALHNVSRPDHGTTGSYDAWPSLLFEGLTQLQGNFEASLPWLLEISAASAYSGPFGQAHELDETGLPFKTTNGWTRGLANNGGSFAEVILRTVFGYDPPWGGGGLLPAFAGVPRKGLEGSKLYGIRLPGGAKMDAELTAEGVQFLYEKQ